MAASKADTGRSPMLANAAHPKPRRTNLNHVHRNALPVEIHPLPTLIPHNPLSLLAIAISYLTQILAPPRRPTYNGYFSSATSSIHITDPDAEKLLWDMGFFGRGSLSRSQPTWLETQKRRGITAEENTDHRRWARRQQKLERARKEQHEITEQLSLENLPNLSSNGSILKSNEGGLDGIAEVLESAGSGEMMNQEQLIEETTQPSAGPSEISKRQKSFTEAASLGNSIGAETAQTNGTIHGFEEWKRSVDAIGLPTPPPTSTCSDTSQAETRPVKRLQRQKTVRFSPTIEAREFDLSSPVISPIKSPGSIPVEEPVEEENGAFENKEHLQITMEEAFFLSYALGVLHVFSDGSDAVLPPTSLLALFRRHSYCPPRSLSLPAEPDDPFMLSYTVYHHYRSAGWVVRSGIKFGVDYLLYNKGPAFSHAEFAVVILPSYHDDYRKETGELKPAKKQLPRKSWWWLHGINRVQAQVHKQLVLCYVEVPSPTVKSEGGSDTDVHKLFSRYKVRDVNVRRWIPNRSRD